MRLVYRIVLHMSWALSLLLAGWAVLFYLTMIDEINDEVDDSLENYAEMLVTRSLAGRELPAAYSGSNNGYYLHDVSAEYAEERPRMEFSDEVFFIPDKDDDEPARVLRTIFRDSGGRYKELTVMTPTIEKDDLQEAILWWIVYLYLFLLLMILLVNVLVLHRTLRPLYALLRWFDSYTVGGKNAPLVNDTKVIEFRRLNEAARTMDPSRPTVACSDQNGDINFITDLIVWRQDVGWRKGTTDDVTVWRDQLQKGWSHLRSGICYGGSGFIGHKSYTAQAAPRANWMPEERQTRFHEQYAKNLQNDSLFWGTWINNMFDYGSVRRPYGVNGAGLVTIDRRERKDAFYLYKALWNKEEPTLHITDKRRTLRDGERQAFQIYSSAGAPTLLAGADTLAVTEYAACQYRTDSVSLQGTVEIKAIAGPLRDSVTLRVGNVLKPKRLQGPRRTANPQPTN